MAVPGGYGVIVAWWKRGTLPRLARPAAIFAAGVLLAMSPWVARNYALFGGIVLTRGNYGLELSVSNGPQAQWSMLDNGARMHLMHPSWNLEAAPRRGDRRTRLFPREEGGSHRVDPHSSEGVRRVERPTNLPLLVSAGSIAPAHRCSRPIHYCVLGRLSPASQTEFRGFRDDRRHLDFLPVTVLLQPMGAGVPAADGMDPLPFGGGCAGDSRPTEMDYESHTRARDGRPRLSGFRFAPV